MSYQPTGSQFIVNGDKYCLGIGMAGSGDQVFAIFKMTGAGWEAQLPVLKFGITPQEIISAGSPGQYLVKMLPLATQQLKNLLHPPKPAVTDNSDTGYLPVPVECVAYDLSLDVAYDPLTQEFKFNKEPPLSHRR